MNNKTNTQDANKCAANTANILVSSNDSSARFTAVLAFFGIISVIGTVSYALILALNL